MLERRIAEIESLAVEDTESALSKANELVDEFPNDRRAFVLRSYVLARHGDFRNAVQDVTRAIEISDPEPANHFDRGRYLMKLQNHAEAVADFTVALDLCDRYGDDYYRESLHFLRADALVELGRKKEALEDLRKVRDDFVLWTTELKTKKNLLDACS